MVFFFFFLKSAFSNFFNESLQELYPGPCRPVPTIKAELRGGKHYPVCSCTKRNGLQDSCLSWRCMLPFNQKGCASLPFPTCGLGRRQLAKYAALPDRTPEYVKHDQPPCPGPD